MYGYFRKGSHHYYKACIPFHDYLMVWGVGWKSHGKSGNGSAQSDDHMPFRRIGGNRMESDMLDSTEWIAYDYLFLLLCNMHYRINITKLFAIGQAVGMKNRMESKQTCSAPDYVCQLQCHQTLENQAMGRQLKVHMCSRLMLLF